MQCSYKRETEGSKLKREGQKKSERRKAIQHGVKWP